MDRPTFTHRGYAVKSWRHEDQEKIREGLDLLADGKLERWHIRTPTGGCAIDIPAGLGELGATMEASARYPGVDTTIRRSEHPSGDRGWFRPPGVVGCIDIQRESEAAHA